MFFAVVCVRNSHSGEFFLDFLYVFGVSVSNNFAVVHSDVTYAVIEIVARGEHVVLHRRERFGRHIRRGKVARSFAFPVFINFVKSFLCFFRDIERVRGAFGNRVEFRFEPFERKFGENLTTSRADRRRSHDEFVVPDYDGDVVENMSKSLRSSRGYRLAFRRFIRLGEINRSVRFYLRGKKKKVFFEFVDSR